MIIGADTGYFISHVNNHPRALQIWHELEDGQHILVISTLTINEVFVYSFKRGVHQDRVNRWLSLLQETNRIEIIRATKLIYLTFIYTFNGHKLRFS